MTSEELLNNRETEREEDNKRQTEAMESKRVAENLAKEKFDVVLEARLAQQSQVNSKCVDANISIHDMARSPSLPSSFPPQLIQVLYSLSGINILSIFI